MWFDSKIAIQHPMMERNPDIPLSYSDYIAKDTRHNTLKYCKVYKFQSRKAAIKRLFKDCFINGSTIMMRREVFETVGYMSELEENRWNQDLAWWFEILIAYPEILYINKPLVKRLNHAGMLSIKYCGAGNNILYPKVRKKCLEAGINLL